MSAAACLHRPGAPLHRLAARQRRVADVGATPARGQLSGTVVPTFTVSKVALPRAAAIVRGDRDTCQERPAHGQRHARARHQRPGDPIGEV